MPNWTGVSTGPFTLPWTDDWLGSPHAPGFDPLSLGPVLYLDARNPYGTGVVPADGTAISTGANGWADLSGTGYVAGQASGGAQPIYRLNVQNGHPALEFSGAQYLTIPSFSLGSHMTVFLGVQLNGIFFMEQSADINSNDGFYVYSNGFGTQIKNNGNSVMTDNIAGWMGTTPTIVNTQYDGASVEAYNQNNLSGSGSGSILNNTVVDTLYIGSRGGSGLFMNGNIYFIYILPYAASAQQRQYLYNGFNDIWRVA